MMSLENIEKLIKNNLETVPYHNFWLLLETGYNPTLLGGICTDKNVFLYNQLLNKKYNVKLHSAQINGENIHKIIKLFHLEEEYIIDVGLGWPILKPIPLKGVNVFSSYGVEFISKVINQVFYIYRMFGTDERLSYSALLSDSNQNEVKKEVENSYDKSINYPFKDTIRFSKIIDNEFYFLKHKTLFYSKRGMLLTRDILTLNDFEILFKEIFKSDIIIAKQVAEKLKMFES